MSVIMGNIDDAVNITIMILIVLTSVHLAFIVPMEGLEYSLNLGSFS